MFALIYNGKINKTRLSFFLAIRIKSRHFPAMQARYDIQKDEYGDGWSVIDSWTNLPAKVNDVEQIGLPFEDADDLADLLSGMYAQSRKQSAH